MIDHERRVGIAPEGEVLAEHERSSGDGAADPKPTKIIKRYTNRKLYDTVESRYVTLDEIAEMVQDGAEVQIIDNRTKDDLTAVTLAQILLEQEKKTSRMPLAILRDMVRNGGGKLQTFLTDEVNPRVSAIRVEAEHAVARVLGRDAEGSAANKKGGPREQAREFVRSSRHAIDEWQRMLDERLHRTVETVVGLPSLHREVQALREKLAEVEKKLEEHRE
ncbi:polyhydroxyalkanoate synthesis regulator DNA-binding domain-containing protein [Vulgatibacter incomptus]|nr:polyhydroxyalkanoate synthesis regulator DNA-binding domain-containing protein [Vulgatibacter incomptus]